VETKNLIEECRWRNKKVLGMHAMIILSLIAMTIARLVIYSSNAIIINHVLIITLLGMIAGYGELIMSKGKNFWPVGVSIVIFLAISANQLGLLVAIPAIFTGFLLGMAFNKIEEAICKKKYPYTG